MYLASFVMICITPVAYFYLHVGTQAHHFQAGVMLKSEL